MADEKPWKEQMTIYFDKFIEYVAKNPKDFLVTFFLLLTPLMMICGYLSYQMIKHIEDKEKNKKKKAIKSNNTIKTRRKVQKAD